MVRPATPKTAMRDEDRQRDADGGHERRAGAEQEQEDGEDREEGAEQALADEAVARLLDEQRVVLDDRDADDVAVVVLGLGEHGLDLVGHRPCWRRSAS